MLCFFVLWMLKSSQIANGQYKDYLVGQLTRMMRLMGVTGLTGESGGTGGGGDGREGGERGEGGQEILAGGRTDGQVGQS